MVKIVDNITLALLSFKEYIADHLDDVGWKNYYNIYLAGDPVLLNKEVVDKVRDKSKEIGLPLIVIDTGNVNTISFELGNAEGKDHVTLTIAVLARDDNQLRTLANIIRRYVNEKEFIIYNYTSKGRTQVSTGSLLGNATLTDVSDLNSDNIIEKYNSLINVTLELNPESYI